MESIMKIIRSFEEYGLFIKGVTKTTENEAYQVRSWFLGMLFGILVASLNMLTGKDVNNVNNYNWTKFLIPPQPWKILIYKDITKITLTLKVFVSEIIHQIL